MLLIRLADIFFPDQLGEFIDTTPYEKNNSELSQVISHQNLNFCLSVSELSQTKSGLDDVEKIVWPCLPLSENIRQHRLPFDQSDLADFTNHQSLSDSRRLTSHLLVRWCRS